MTANGSYERPQDRLMHAADAAPDDRGLRLTFLDAIRSKVAFDAFAWLMTDPVTMVGSSPVADVPGLAIDQLPRLIRLKYSTIVARWTLPDRPAVMSLVTATDGDLTRSVVWRDLMSGHGVVDVASMVFVDRFGCWAFLDLWRSAPAQPFSPGELDHLNTLIAPMTAALRQSQAKTLLHPAERDVEPTGPVVLVLSPDLAVRAQTPETERVLRKLVPPTGGAPPVPAAAYNVGAQLLALEGGIDAHPAVARVHVQAERWVTLRAARMVDQPDIAVTVEDITPDDRVDLFVRAVGLTAREAELLQLLRSGNSTREAATEMVLSPHTVGDHLKSVFAKTGCRSRGELLGRATGR